MKAENLDSKLNEVLRNATYFNAYMYVKDKSRTTEVHEVLDKLDSLDSNFERAKIHDYNFSDKSMNDIHNEYKSLYDKQERFYLSNINDLNDDYNMLKNYAENTVKLDYIEKNILTHSDRLLLQKEVKEELLDSNKNQDKLEKIDNLYSKNLEEFYRLKTENSSTEDIDEKLIGLMVEKKIYDNSLNAIKNNKSEIEKINKDDLKNVNRDIKASKEIDKFYSDNLMWKIVDQQQKNSIHLNNESPDVSLDARSNVDKLNKSISTNHQMKSSNNKNSIKANYTNSYKNLTNIDTINKTNDLQAQESNEKKQKFTR